MISLFWPLGHIDHPLGEGGKDGRERERLHGAPDGEKGMRVRDRARPVCLVPGMEMPRKAAARILRKRARWARKWPGRHREGCLAALPGLPRSGRPRAVGHGWPRKTVGRMSESLATPDRARSMIAGATGAVHRHSTARRLMREFGPSPKVARLAHVGRAGRRAAAAWRRRGSGPGHAVQPRRARPGTLSLREAQATCSAGLVCLRLFRGASRLRGRHKHAA